MKGPVAKQRPGRHRPVQVDQQLGPAGQGEMRKVLAEGVRMAVCLARGGQLPDGSASHKGPQREVAPRKASTPLVSLWTRNIAWGLLGNAGGGGGRGCQAGCPVG